MEITYPKMDNKQHICHYPDKQGDWVRYSEAAKLEAQLAEQKQKTSNASINYLHVLQDQLKAEAQLKDMTLARDEIQKLHDITIAQRRMKSE